VVTAYTLAFGSLLLPGGRLADLLGRKVTFLTGLALAHGYDTAFWWTAGGALLRPGPLDQKRTRSPARGGVTTAQAGASGERVR
jgi:MFS family permease